MGGREEGLLLVSTERHWIQGQYWLSTIRELGWTPLDSLNFISFYFYRGRGSQGLVDWNHTHTSVSTCHLEKTGRYEEALRWTEWELQRFGQSDRKGDRERESELLEWDGRKGMQWNVKWDYNSITAASYICFNWTRWGHLGCPFVFWSAGQAWIGKPPYPPFLHTHTYTHCIVNPNLSQTHTTVL